MSQCDWLGKGIKRTYRLQPPCMIILNDVMQTINDLTHLYISIAYMHKMHMALTCTCMHVIVGKGIKSSYRLQPLACQYCMQCKQLIPD